MRNVLFKKLFPILFLLLVPGVFGSNITNSSNLLDCEFLFNTNLVEDFFGFFAKEDSTVRSFLPETKWVEFNKESKLAMCNEILNSSMTTTEKKVYIAQLLNVDPRKFKFWVVDKYHEKIEVENLTFGNELNSTFIKNAGYKFITLNPSVKYNTTIFIPEETQAVRSYHFDIEVPEDFEAPEYPVTLNGFCEIDYDDVETTVDETIFFNEEQVSQEDLITHEGSGKFEEKLTSDLITSIEEGEVTINANLEIDSQYSADFYKWNTYCCESGDNGCTKYCHDCDKVDVQTFSDRVIFTDNYYVTRYKPKEQKKHEIWSENGLLHIRINMTDLDKFRRVTIGKFLDMTNYYSVIRYKFEPVDFLYFEALDSYKEEMLEEGKKVNKTVSARRYDFKSPFMTIENDYVEFVFAGLPEDIEVSMETFFDSVPFEYTIEVDKKKTFENIVFHKNQFFYWDNDTLKITPYLIAKGGIYNDSFNLIYKTQTGKEFIKPGRTGEATEFNFEGEGEIILQYPGDDEYFKTIARTSVLREPILLNWFYDWIGLRGLCPKFPLLRAAIPIF